MKLSKDRFWKGNCHKKIGHRFFKIHRFSYETTGKNAAIFDVEIQEYPYKKTYHKNCNPIPIKPEKIHIEIEKHFNI